MNSKHHEAALGDYLRKIVPLSERDRQGASDADIAAIQALTTRELPHFYVWFLRSMGRSMGRMAYPRLDLTVDAVRSFYLEASTQTPTRRYLVIGVDAGDSFQGESTAYLDLARQVDGDARVHIEAAPDDDDDGNDELNAPPAFESFHEMLGFNNANRYRVQTRQQVCDGTLEGPGRSLPHGIDAIMSKLKFEQPTPTGEHCRVYESDEATLLLMRRPRNDNLDTIAFTLGADHEGTIRRLLGVLGTEGNLAVTARRWHPPLERHR